MLFEQKLLEHSQWISLFLLLLLFFLVVHKSTYLICFVLFLDSFFPCQSLVWLLSFFFYFCFLLLAIAFTFEVVPPLFKGYCFNGFAEPGAKVLFMEAWVSWLAHFPQTMALADLVYLCDSTPNSSFSCFIL